MKLFLIIALFLITPFAGAQIDSLKVAEQYHKSADSLYQLGDYMEAYAKERWALIFEGKMKVNEPPPGLYNTLDSLVRFVVSDTTKYEYYLGYAYKFLTEGDIEYAYAYYNSALLFVALPDDAIVQAMDSLIFTLPTDTVYATDQRPARQLYSSRLRNRGKLYPPVEPGSQDTLFVLKDSSLFSGVYIYNTPWNVWIEYTMATIGYVSSVYHYENGIQLDYVMYYQRSKTTSFAQQTYYKDGAFHREAEPDGQETYLESIVNYDEGYTIKFSPAGDTLYLQYRNNKNESVAVEFSPEGDTLAISVFSRDENHYVRFNPEHKIIHEFHEYNFKDSSYSTSYSLNEVGDTIRLDTWVNGQICGYYIEEIYLEDSVFILKTNWDKFQLLDILIDSAVFIGYNNEVITEQEFILLMPEFSTEFRIDSVPKELQNEVPFKYMFFLPGEKTPSSNWKTRTKKVKKISKRYQKTLE